MVLNLYWPAVSQICSLTTSPLTVIDLKIISLDRLLKSKIYPNSSEVTLLEWVISKSTQYWRFAHWAISDYDHFE